MRALIQKHDQEFNSLNACAAYLGFKGLGRETDFFNSVDELEAKLDREAIVVGGVGYVMRAFDALGIDRPTIPSIPASLVGFAERPIWKTTLKEVRSRIDSGEEVFLKPAPDNLKKFTGYVARNYADLAKTADLEDDFPVVCAGVINMISEYRTY